MIRRAGPVVGALVVTAGVAVVVAHIATGRIDAALENFIVHTSMVGTGLGLVAAASARRQSGNRAVVVVVAISALLAVELVLWTHSVIAAPDAGPGSYDAMVFGDAAPVDLGIALALSQWGAAWIWVVSLFGWLTWGLMWFPDGRLAGRSWAPLPWVTGLGIALASGTYAVAYLPGGEIPYSLAEEGLVGAYTYPLAAGAVIILGSVVATLVSLVVKYRAASSDVRDGLKWMALGTAVLVASLLVLPFDVTLATRTTLVGVSVMLACYGIAIVRHRAFDIDLIISRTLVYGSLAAFITVVYVAIVVGVDRVIAGGDGTPNPAISLVAITIVAITVQPLRRRLTAFANRLVYGRRSTPYEVLSEFSQRVAAADEHLLETVARSLVEGTPASAATVWVEDAGELHPAASWPVDRAWQAPVAVKRGTDALPGTRAFPVFHREDLMGAISLSLPPGSELSPTDVGLAEQVAGGMGLALRNLALTESLRHRVEELQESRRRIVTVRDETRRRLERDLHDGAQQRLVALRVRLGLLGRIAEKEGGEDLAALVGGLSREAQEAIDALRDFARGVYPPLLEAEGLGAALTAQARRVPLPVTVAVEVARHGREVEAAVYFSILEALQNVAKHAEASRAAVEVTDKDGELRFLVTDDGRGIGDSTAGFGLRNIRDRIEAVGGSLTVAARPSGGTAVEGLVPLGSSVEVAT